MRYVRAVSIDPGSRFCGACAYEFNTGLDTMRVLDAYTLRMHRIHRARTLSMDLDEPPTVERLRELEDALYRFFDAWKPGLVSCESAYFKQQPKPYEILTLCIGATRTALRRYDDHQRLHLIEPSVAKNDVGVKGGANDKDLTRAALQRIPDLLLPDNYLELTEHAVDAIAIGYSTFQMLRRRLS